MSSRHKGPLGELLHQFAYNARTVWLFTRSDLKTIFVPTTIFGITNYLALPAYGLEPGADASLSSLSRRLPLILLWIWIHLISFTVNNQRSPDAVREDALNKPWRPLPSGRISPGAARVLGALACPASAAASLLVGGLRQSLAGALLTVWYNAWGGSDAGPLTRNLITAWGYVCFTSGALEVACGRALPLDVDTNARMLVWFGVLGAVVATTMHTQDMEDQDGDRQRSRRTAPLVFGDAWCRWSIALPMVCWGLGCPRFWSTTFLVASVSQTLALTVAWRTLFLRNMSADRVTFWVWNAWMSSLYVLPLFSN